MNRESGRDQFLELPTGEIRRIVLQKSKPRVGIFVTNGNRRQVMCQTRLSPTSDEFYQEYARFFADSLRKSLDIFFSHGLEILFFPLFGPSLFARKNKFQSITIPIAYQKIFKSEELLRFYREKGIRVKAYGNLSQLEKIDVKNLNMAGGIKETIEKTARYKNHTVYFGFMSENTPGLEMPQLIIDLYKSKNRSPTSKELIKRYYGEDVPPADFLIFSDRFSGLGPLPPLVSGPKTQMYYLPAPGFLAFNSITYRKILHDLLFILPLYSPGEYTDKCIGDLETLENFYEHHKNTIIGTGKNIGEFVVADI